MHIHILLAFQGQCIFLYCLAIRINFLSRYVSIVEPLRHVPVRIVSSGGTSNNPITIIVTPSEQSPISAMGKYVRTYVCHIYVHNFIILFAYFV